jgi:MFS family permease
MLTVLRQRNFALLWVGGLVSSMGDWVLFIALPFYLYTLTNSALATGLMVISRTLPGLLLGSVAGVFVDRWDRKRIMIAADLSRAAVLLLMLLVHSPDQVWILYVATFAQATLSQFFNPAQSAIVPRLVPPADLVAANALNAMNWEVARLITPPLGGLLLAAFGLGSAVLVDSASYLFSALTLTLIALPALPASLGAPAHPAPVTAPWRHVWAEWIAGLRLVQRDRLIAALFIVAGFSMIGEGLINVVWIIFIKDSLHGGALEQGWLATAQAAGGLLGGAMLGRLGNRVSPVVRLAAGGVGLWLYSLVILNFPDYALTLVLRVGVGVCIIAFYVTLDTLLQQSVADRYRGRVFGAFGTTSSVMMLLGQGAASLLAGPLGAVTILAVMAFAYLLAGLAALVLLRPDRLALPAHSAPLDVTGVAVD